jgi:hypothetical protein
MSSVGWPFAAPPDLGRCRFDAHGLGRSLVGFSSPRLVLVLDEPLGDALTEHPDPCAGCDLDGDGALVVVDIDDRAEDAAAGHHVVADLERCDERLLGPLPVALWTDQQEIEAHDQEHRQRETDERASLSTFLSEDPEHHGSNSLLGGDQAAYRLPLGSPLGETGFRCRRAQASGRTPSGETPRWR